MSPGVNDWVQQDELRLECQVFQTYEELAELKEEWDSTVLRLKAPIYVSYDWSRLWWQYYGRGRELRLFLFRTGDAIVGIVPLYIDSIGPAPFGLRVARIVGANLPPKTFDPPIEIEFAATIWRRILEVLFGNANCDYLSFGPVSSQHISARLAAADEHSNGALELDVGCEQRDVRTLYTLPSTFEEYLGSLDSKERKVRRKKLRDLEARGPLRADIIDDPNLVEREFEAFAEMHTRQWQAEGRPGHFYAWPQGFEYNKALVRCLGKQGRGRFVRLVQGEQVITNQYAFAFGSTLYAELPARLFGPDWDRFSLGATSQIKLIESAIQSGFHLIESGLGHYEYKVLTGGVEQPVNTVCVGRRRSRARIAGWRKIAGIQRFAFHKLWYRKILPRLPGRLRAGQSWSEIRMDF